VREDTGLPYASTETATDSTGMSVPVMHACGHDMHVTWLVGAATIMAQMRETWKGTLVAGIPARGRDGRRRAGDD
jgi:hippurate hydrolase